MPMVHDNKILKDRRIELRKNQTPAEEKLWSYLRNNGLKVKFKRQHGIGGYIADFYCANKKLVIELDGNVHESKEAREYDEVRDKHFKELGFTTIRFWNDEVENNIREVLEKIKNYLKNINSTKLVREK